MKRIRYRFSVIAIIAVFTFQAVPASAGSKGGPEHGRVTGDRLHIQKTLPKRAIGWKVSGPDDILIESKKETITVKNSLPDGQYSYEVIGYLDKDAKQSYRKSRWNDGRKPGTTPRNPPVGIIQTGYFRIYNGVVLKDDGKKE